MNAPRKTVTMIGPLEDMKGELKGQKNITAYETAIFHNPQLQ